MSDRRRVEPRRAAGERAALDERRLRTLARALVAESSLRRVAHEIGMSPPGLRGFLDGASPRSATLEKMRAWHFKGAGVEGTPVETVRSAIHVLVAGLPQSERSVVIRQILEIVAEAHLEQGTNPPGWIPVLVHAAEASRPRECRDDGA